MESVRVELADRSYEVAIGDALLAGIGERARLLLPSARRAFVARDVCVPESMLRVTRDSMEGAGFQVFDAGIHADERRKSLKATEDLLRAMADARLDRGDVLIALGGGLTGDLGAFAAAVYKRGIGVIQCPTTLLAMVDASVGGKTGVNLETATGLTKNMVGAFWQPAGVIADLDTLGTLPSRVLRAGAGEMLKHALIAGPDDTRLWQDTTRWLAGGLVRNSELVGLIARNVRIKASIVGTDERETAPSRDGGRALLNLGHTFAHAIETIPHLAPDGVAGHAPLQHGEAVAIGLVAATAASRVLGRCSERLETTVRSAVESLGIRTRLQDLPDTDSLLDNMRHDKKAVGGELRIVVPIEGGGASVVDSPESGVLESAWSAIRA